MAAGDRLLDATGRQILDSSGNVRLSNGTDDSGCCCGAYIQTRDCLTGALVDRWIAVAGLTYPYYFFKSGGFGPATCGYVLGNEPRSDSPGTILTGFSTTTGCGVATGCKCANCSDASPEQISATIADVAHSIAGGGGTTYEITSGTMNGTFCLSRATVTSCTWIAYPTVCTVTRYVSGVPSGTSNEWEVYINQDGGTQLIVARIPAWNLHFFQGALTTSLCSDPHSFTNVQTVAGPTELGLNGTADTTPGPC